jgi:hypothetical protein
MRGAAIVALIVLTLGACTSTSTSASESKTAFGRACRALGDANGAASKSDWTAYQADYVKVGAEAGGISDTSLAAAAREVAASVAAHPADATVLAVASDPNGTLLTNECQKQYGNGY